MNIFAMLVLVLATSAISLTITKGSIFENLREQVIERSQWFGKLVSCPYCTSHWVSFILVAIYQPRLVSSWWPFDLLVSAFAIVALAAPVSWVVYHSFTGMAKTNEEEVEQLREALQIARDKLAEQAATIRSLRAA